MKTSIIIPCYNEQSSVLVILNQLLSLKTEKEIIVVDDGSSDRTNQLLSKFVKNKPINLISNKVNKGKGYSIRRALRVVKGDVILIQDADLEYDPKDIPRILSVFKNKNIQVVYGSRVLKKNPISHWTFNLGGKLVTLVTNFLYGSNLTDEPTGYKAFRKSTLDKIKLSTNGFDFCPEVTAKLLRLGVKIYEIPISYNPRPISEKKIKWQDGISAIFTLIKFRFRA